MAFVSGSAVPLGHVNSLNYSLDIIAVPAIFADPKQAWGEYNDHWLASLASEIPGARVLQYDHLLPEERSVEIKPLSHPDHQSSVELHANTHNRLESFGFEDWAERLTNTINKQRNSPALRRRPLLFICHSTGGIVTKQALSDRSQSDGISLAACCLWIAFLSTPHRGSSILSDYIFSQTLTYRLRLKFEIGEKLRDQLALSNPFLEHLNDQFCSGSTLGVQISSYVETEETELEVLTENEGEQLTKISATIVDPHSAELSSSNSPIDEELFYMRANHVGIAALANDPAIRRALVEDIKSIVHSTNSLERAAHHDLIEQIRRDVRVDVHQFYKAQTDHEVTPTTNPTTKVWSESTSLGSFLSTGPSQTLQRRFDRTPDGSQRPSREASNVHTPVRRSSQTQDRKPSIMLQPPSNSYGLRREQAPQCNIRTKTGLLTQPRSDPNEPIHHDQTYPAPSKLRDRFTWTHVPFSVTGWVDPVMKTISKDKGNPELHGKLLMDQLWKAHHNRSRHASHHSRFVRPYCKVLLPRDENQQDEILSPSSPVRQLQFALFLPYLHWDTFRSLKKRNDIVKLRSSQDRIRPISGEVLRGKSLEHKVIWQFYGSNMPVHCRRTLDGYGYPSLANTDARDMDQVMFKQTSRLQTATQPRSKKPRSYFSSRLLSMRSSRHMPVVRQEVDKDAGYVLMVDELWLWILQDDVMVTFATPKEQEPDTPFDTDLQADLKNEVLKDVGGDFARPVDDCFDHAALLVFHAIRALIEEAEDPALNVFKTFEEHISEISELHTVAFKQFRDSHKIEDPKQLLGGSHNLDYSSDLDNLLELRDVEDELNTIKKLFVEQRKIITDMEQQYREAVNPRGKGLHGTMLLKEAENMLLGYEEQVDSMIHSSQIAQNAFENLLDLKQKHSNIVEAHMTRFQTETASEQAKSVMIFTIITIIFMPLSYLSSLFGMNVSEWSGTSTNPSLSYVLLVMGSVSLGVIVVSLTAAFNLPLRRALRRFWLHTLRARLAEPVCSLLSRAPVRRLRRIASDRQPDLERGTGATGAYPHPAQLPQQPAFPQRRAAAIGPGKLAEANDQPAAPMRSPTDESEMDVLWKQHAE